MRLDGFGLFVDDMAKMIRFYRDVLGFEIKEECESFYMSKGTPSIITVPKINHMLSKAEVPNETTASAIAEGRKLIADPSAPRYSSMEELKAALK